MTIVAGLVSDGRVYLAADQSVSLSDSVYTLGEPKVWVAGQMVVGGAGDVGAEWASVRRAKRMSDVVRATRTGSVDVLVGQHGRLYHVSSGCSWAVLVHHGAIGSEPAVAAALAVLSVLGAGEPMETVRRAVLEAERCCWGVRCGADGPDCVSI